MGVARDAGLTLCFWRLSLACAILLPIVRHHFAEMRDLVSARLFELAIVGGIGLTLCQGLIYTGLQYTSATTAGIVMALCPIFTLVLAHLVLGEAMGMWQVVGAALSFAGMLVIVARGDLAALVHLQLNPGELLVVISALCWGLYTVLLKRLKFGIARLPLLVLLLGMGALIACRFICGSWSMTSARRSTLPACWRSPMSRPPAARSCISSTTGRWRPSAPAAPACFSICRPPSSRSSLISSWANGCTAMTGRRGDHRRRPGVRHGARAEARRAAGRRAQGVGRCPAASPTGDRWRSPVPCFRRQQHRYRN